MQGFFSPRREGSVGRGMRPPFSGYDPGRGFRGTPHCRIEGVDFLGIIINLWRPAATFPFDAPRSVDPGPALNSIMSQPIWILGASGYVGSAYQRLLESRGIPFRALPRTALDY